MLFERIRRTQKPVFIFLAFMFGLGFVALGIGQGANSINLGDLFNTGGSSGTSISDLSSRVQSHPKDAGAWLQLARAYQADGQNSQAISSFQNYLGLKPNNATALSATATLLEQRGQTDATKVQQAQAAAAAYTQVGSATAASSLKLAPALTHPLMNTLAQPAQHDRPDPRIGRGLRLRPGDGAAPEAGEALAAQRLLPAAPRPRRLRHAELRDRGHGARGVTWHSSPNLPKAQRTQLEQQITQFKLLAKSTPSSTNPAGPDALAASPAEAVGRFRP